MLGQAFTQMVGAGLPPAEGLTMSHAFIRQEAYLSTDVRPTWHHTSDWWLEELTAFWDHPSRYCLVEEVGRRGGKSSTIPRVAVCEGVDRTWHVPPGEIHSFAFLSVKQGEAEQRLMAVAAILAAREIPHHRGSDRFGPFVRLKDRPLDWRAIAANFRTAVGVTCFGFSADELARWIDQTTSANPAKHVLSSVRPTISSHLEEGAHEYLISSPWAEEGAHWEAVDLGDTADQQVSHATSWEANPIMTPEICARLCREEEEEGKESDFARDYEAIAMKIGVLGRLDPTLVQWLTAPPRGQTGDLALSGSDLGMKVNSSAQAMGYKRGDDYLVSHLQEWTPVDMPLKPSEVCAEQRENLLMHGASSTVADGHYRESLTEAFGGTELVVIDAPLSPVGSFVRLRNVMREGRLKVWCGADMKKRLTEQLKGTSLHATATGMKVKMVTARDGAHCDLVAALALLVWQQSGARIASPRSFDQTLLGAHQEKEKYAKRMVKERRRGQQLGRDGRIKLDSL